MKLKPIFLVMALSGLLINPSLAGNYNLPAEFNLPNSIIDTSAPTILPPPVKQKAKVETIKPNVERKSSIAEIKPSHKEKTAITVVETKPKPIKPTLKLELSSHSDTYRVGDSISFSIKSNKRCYLTVLNVGTTGKITVFYPNALRPNNYIKKNTRLSLPSDELMPIEAIEISKPRHSKTDEETVIAICRISKTSLFKQEYQFKRYNFHEFPPTVNWKNQITKVGKNEEVRMEISFKAKPALDRSKVDFLKTQ